MELWCAETCGPAATIPGLFSSTINAVRPAQTGQVGYLHIPEKEGIAEVSQTPWSHLGRSQLA